MLFKKTEKESAGVEFCLGRLSCSIGVGGSPFNDAAVIPSAGNFLLVDVLPARKE